MVFTSSHQLVNATNVIYFRNLKAVVAQSLATHLVNYLSIEKYLESSRIAILHIIFCKLANDDINSR